MNVHKKLIANIKENSKIEINGHTFRIYTKTHYTNVANPNLKYTKFSLSENYILVINPDRKSIFIGQIVEDFDNGENFPEKISYMGKTFSKFEQDYQIVTQIEFGEPSKCEGECLWVDYTCDQDENLCIDMAYVYRDKKRADIYARYIDIQKIKVLEDTKQKQNV